ncbi:MAG: OmpH family outer membrane protein [Fibrobacter sp.]|jgi:outer membrane protein|nr:OmpH family outer membrane protein [Fibrobacter sp.]HON09626.1 OmpH family outer membrane protein [Chitinispirillaceae bacterium]
MRKVMTAGVLALCMAATATWAELKIGYINSELIFMEYEGTKDAQKKFNNEVAKWEQEASKRQKEIKDLKEQLDKQSLLLSNERKKELEDSLNQKMISYQTFLQEKFGQKGEALVKNEELTKPIIEKINKIIEKIAKEENYDYIFDARAGGIVFAKPVYDLSQRVLAQLSKEK